MQAGRMRYRLELQEPVTERDKFGDEATVYVPVRVVHAERVRLDGQSRMEAGEIFPGYNVRFNVRDAHPVKEKWRVRQLGGYLYTVVNILPNANRGMLTLVCERVNQ